MTDTKMDYHEFIEAYFKRFARDNGIRFEGTTPVFPNVTLFKQVMDEAVNAYNNTPQDELGGLSPNQAWEKYHAA